MKIADQVKMFDYDIDKDMIFVWLLNGNKVDILCTDEDVKSFTFEQTSEALLSLCLMDANKFNLQKFKEALRPFRRRDFYYYFPSLYKKKKRSWPSENYKRTS